MEGGCLAAAQGRVKAWRSLRLTIDSVVDVGRKSSWLTGHG
jgi:hypothetical protein